MRSAARGAMWLAGLGVLACGEPPELAQWTQPLSTSSFCDGQSPDPAYSGTSDTQITSEAPAATYGANQILRITAGLQVRRALLRWDLTSLDPRITVRTAQLSLTSTDATANAVAAYALRRPWTEEAASWDIAGPTSWEIPGAGGSTDRSDVALAAVGPAPSGRYVVPLNGAGVAEVTAWVRDPASNLGLAIVNETGSDELVIASREGDAGDRPCLVVAYDLPDGGAGLPDAGAGRPAKLLLGCGCGAAPLLPSLIVLCAGLHALAGSRRRRRR